MKKHWISEAELERFYRLMSVRMVGFDCGQLCAPGNGGVPCCCEPGHAVPILYRDEYRWHKRQSRFWRKFKVRSRADRELKESLHKSYVPAACRGSAECQRTRRALVCRTFPFEPHLDDDGNVVGITYQYEHAHFCPLVGKPKSTFNPLYIRNSVRLWQELLALLPEEKAMYVKESRKLRRKFRKQTRRVHVFH